MNKISDYHIKTTKADIKALFDLIKSCSYLIGNDDYIKKINLTKIFYRDNPTVNAYATSLDEEFYHILIFAGLCNAMKFASLAMAKYEIDRDISDFINTITYLAKKIIKLPKDTHSGEFTEKDYNDCISELKLKVTHNIVREAKGFFSGSIIGLIGHELGHVVLGHIDTNEHYDRKPTLTKNNERQADLFASSICESTPFAKYSLVGNLIMEILFTWMDKCSEANINVIRWNNNVAEENMNLSHPDGKERATNWFNEHKDYLTSFGIDYETFLKFLP